MGVESIPTYRSGSIINEQDIVELIYLAKYKEFVFVQMGRDRIMLKAADVIRWPLKTILEHKIFHALKK